MFFILNVCFLGFYDWWNVFLDRFFEKNFERS
jgi:hypothetical protein